MSQAVATRDEASEVLTALLIPLADRQLLLPNTAVAELIAYRPPITSDGMPDWFLGQIAWRDLSLPLLSFELASGGSQPPREDVRVAVLNAIGGRPLLKFIALLVQGIPHAQKVSSDLPRADLALAPLELDAVQPGEQVARIPDLLALEQLLADAGLIE